MTAKMLFGTSLAESLYDTKEDITTKNSLPVQNIQSLHNSNLEETELALQNTYNQLQSTLLDSVHHQVSEIQEQLNERDLELKRTQDEKKDMGVGLYKANAEVFRLNEQYCKVNEANLKLIDQLKLIENEKLNLHNYVKQLTEQNKKLSNDLAESTKKNEDISAKCIKLTEVNTIYNSDVKIHHRVESKLKSELEYVDEKRRIAETDLEDLKKAMAKLLESKSNLELILHQQRVETDVSSQAISKMNQELNILTDAKKKMEKQWEEAISAMTKRDKAIQKIDEMKSKVDEQLRDVNDDNRVLKREKENCEKMLREKELECQSLQDQITYLKHTLQETQTKLHDTRGDLVEVQVSESLHKQELQKTSKSFKLAKDELERKSFSLSKMKNSLEKLKSEFDEKTRHAVFENVARKEEELQKSKKAAIDALELEHDNKTIDLRGSNARFHLEVKDLKDRLNDTKEENVKLNKKYEFINNNYLEMYEKAQNLVYELERKEHDVCQLKGKLQDIADADLSVSLQVTIRQMQKELDKKDDNYEKLQKILLDSDNYNMRLKKEIAELKDDNLYLRTELGITDISKDKTATQIKVTKSELFESKIEMAKLYAELKRIKPMVDMYKKKMFDLEQELIESRIQVQKIHANTDVAATVLQSEIRIINEDRRELRKVKIAGEKATQKYEHKYRMAQEKIAKLTSDKSELQRTCFDLKIKADELEKKYFETQIHSRRIAEQAVRSIKEVNTRLNNNDCNINSIPVLPSVTNENNSETKVSISPPVWHTLAVTPVELKSDISAAEIVPQDDLPDIQSWKLNIESVKSERDFLANENKILIARVEQLSKKLDKSEKQFNDMQYKLKSLERDLKSTQDQLKSCGMKYVKAEKIAASIEKQFKEAKPNVRIDYSLLLNAEPSIQLMSSLILKENEITDMKSGLMLNSKPVSRKTTMT